MTIFAVIGAAITLILEILGIIKDYKNARTKEEHEKLELRKKELPVITDAIARRDSSAYLLSLSRMRNARKK